MTQNQKITGSEIKSGLLVKNTFLTLTSNSLYLIIGIIFIPIIIHYLGAERFGIFSLTWLTLGYFSFFDLGLGRAATKFIAESIGKGQKENIYNFFWCTVIFQSILGILSMVVVIFFTPFLCENILNINPKYLDETKNIFYLVAFAIPAVTISSSFRGLLEAKQRFDLITAVNIPYGLGSFLLPVLGVVMKLGLRGIVGLLLILKFTVLFIWVLICLNKLNILKYRFFVNKETICSLFKFGGWVTVSSLITPIFVSLDRFIIGVFFSIATVTYYTVPYEIINRLCIIPGSLSVVLFPAFSILDGERADHYTKVLFERSIKLFIILFGFIISLLIFFAHYIMKFWLGNDFAQNSTLVFQILLIGLLFGSIASVPYNFLQGVGRPDITAKFNLLELLIYIPLAYFLIKWQGVNGAGAAWTTRICIDMLLLFFACQRLKKINIFSIFDKALIVSVLTLLTFILSGYIVMQFSWRISGLLLLTSCFLIFNWYFILKKDERNWLEIKIKKFIMME